MVSIITGVRVIFMGFGSKVLRDSAGGKTERVERESGWCSLSPQSSPLLLEQILAITSSFEIYFSTLYILQYMHLCPLAYFNLPLLNLKFSYWFIIFLVFLYNFHPNPNPNQCIICSSSLKCSRLYKYPL